MMRSYGRRAAGFLACVLVCLPLQASAQIPPIDASLSQKIDADVAKFMTRTQTPGVALAIVGGDTILYTKGYGVRDVDSKAPVEATTPFEIGSMTKQFTAAAILQLRDAGKVSLDAKLATYLPKAPHASEVTIRELLSHTAGMPEFLEGADLPGAAASPTTPEGLLARIAAKPLTSVPGTTYAYSNTDFLLLGRVIEVASGTSYDAYVRRHLLVPAGMTHTTTIANEATLPDRAHGYVIQGGVKPAPPLDDSWAWAAGNIVSTVGDFAKWMSALRGGAIVPPADYREMTTPVPATDGVGYGFGLIADTAGKQPRVWHTGGTFGFDTIGAFYPRKNLSIIVFTNRAYGPSLQIAGAVFADLFPGDVPAAAALETPREDRALTARVKAFVFGFVRGKVDRSQMTAAANAALTDEKLAGVAQQLAPLGTPTFSYVGIMPNGTKNPTLIYRAQFPQITLRVTVHIDPATDKFDGIYFAPE